MTRIYELTTGSLRASEAANPEFRPVAEPQGRLAGEASTEGQIVVSSVDIRTRNAGALIFEDDKRAAEEYRIIRTKLLRHAQAPRLVAVSSADAGDGKTLTALNLAAMLSLKQETSVLLIDADVRRGRTAAMLGIDGHPGLTDVLAERTPLSGAVVNIREYPRLDILTAGELGDDKADLLDSAGWAALLAHARGAYRLTVIDTAPLGGILDAHLVMNASDGMLVVVRPDHTNRTHCMSALKAVPPEKMLGVIVNAVKPWFLNKPQDSYYYVR